MSEKHDTDLEVLARISTSLDSDVLDAEAYSDAEINSLIRAEGGDPARIADKGALLVSQLRKAKRLAWMQGAKKRVAAVKDALSRQLALPKLPRLELAALLEKEAAALGIAFHKHKAEAASEEELLELWKEIQALKHVAGEDGGDDGEHQG